MRWPVFLFFAYIALALETGLSGSNYSWNPSSPRGCWEC